MIDYTRLHAIRDDDERDVFPPKERLACVDPASQLPGPAGPTLACPCPDPCTSNPHFDPARLRQKLPAAAFDPPYWLPPLSGHEQNFQSLRTEVEEPAAGIRPRLHNTTRLPPTPLSVRVVRHAVRSQQQYTSMPMPILTTVCNPLPRPLAAPTLATYHIPPLQKQHPSLPPLQPPDANLNVVKPIHSSIDRTLGHELSPRLRAVPAPSTPFSSEHPTGENSLHAQARCSTYDR